MVSSRVFLILIFCCLCLVPTLASLNADIEVQKVVAEKSNGIYSVSIGYRALREGQIGTIRIHDGLPPSLELIRGDLVARGLEQAPTEWTWHEYRVTPFNVEFSLRNKSIGIELPPAQVFYTKKENPQKWEYLSTQPVILVAEIPIPEGFFSNPLLIFAFTIVVPVIAAYLLISHFQKVAAADLHGSAIRKKDE